MQTIDIASWDRREHFQFFRRSDLPFHNTNVNVDASGLRNWAKRNDISLNSLLLHVVMRAVNQIDNLKYRLRDETVVLHDLVHPCFAHLRRGEELFRMVTADFVDDVRLFAATVRSAIDASDSWFGLEKIAGRDDLVFISPMPWFSFTAVDHTMSLRREDAIPRITWGRIFEDRGRELLPFNLQVNHMFVDGLHVARLLESLERGIRSTVES